MKKKQAVKQTNPARHPAQHKLANPNPAIKLVRDWALFGYHEYWVHLANALAWVNDPEVLYHHNAGQFNFLGVPHLRPCK